MRWLLMMAILCGVPSPMSWDARLDEVQHAYSIEASDQLVAELAEYCQSSEDFDIQKSLSNAYLIKAELLRFEFEQLPKYARQERSALGNDLDEAAMAGMEICKELPESSEKYRLLADLRGTLIRTKFRAKKHRKKMMADAERALAIDPKNARAYVSKAKLFLFADERHGGDVETALELLQHAQKLDASLETAQLLYAYGLEEASRADEAIGYYKKILEQNPRCRPARAAVEELRGKVNG